MTRPKIAVEIFHDTAMSTKSTDIALEGITIVNEFTSSALMPSQVNRKLHTDPNPNRAIRPGHINWPNLPAPMSILLTNRQIEAPFANVSAHGLTSSIARLAIVNVSSPQPAITTAHEIGHLLHASYPNKPTDHCPDEACTMHTYLKPDIEVSQRVKRKGLSGWLERNGYLQAEYKNSIEPGNNKFCTPCQEQLAKRAFFMAKYLQGEDIPEFLR